MRNIISMLVIASIAFSYCSCKKSSDSGDSMPPPEPVRPDTLSTGWSKIKISESSSLADIYFANNTTGYVAGSGDLYKSTNGGLTWESVYKTSQMVINIGMTKSLSAFFVGKQGFIRTTNGGSSYVLTQSVAGNDLFFVNDSTGFIIATSGFYLSEDTGNNWQQVPTNNLVYGQAYSTLFAINENTIWIGNETGIYKTTGSITDWQKAVITGSTGNYNFQGIFAPSPNIVYAVEGGEVFKSVNGGANFSFLKKLETGFSDIHFIDELVGYVCSSQFIYKTIDGGTTWSTVVCLGDDEENIIEIHFTDVNHGWACTSKGSVLIFKQ
jgi:photosystem II stability/assembly factor-like uncharacterized protein